ncbi:MAG: hypothetical protein ACOC0N_07855, partial [Chroococcales cyanobacterium]
LFISNVAMLIQSTRTAIIGDKKNSSLMKAKKRNGYSNILVTMIPEVKTVSWQCQGTPSDPHEPHENTLEFCEICGRTPEEVSDRSKQGGKRYKFRNSVIGLGLLFAVVAIGALSYHFLRPRDSILEEVEEETPTIINNLN